MRVGSGGMGVMRVGSGGWGAEGWERRVGWGAEGWKRRVGSGGLSACKRVTVAAKEQLGHAARPRREAEREGVARLISDAREAHGEGTDASGGKDRCDGGLSPTRRSTGQNDKCHGSRWQVSRVKSDGWLVLWPHPGSTF